MKPEIDSTRFGSITIDGVRYEHDVYLFHDGVIQKRKKKLSKRFYGTSHNISADEIEHILTHGGEALLIGTGQYGRVQLSDPAIDILHSKEIQVDLQPTPEAILTWNEMEGSVTALFHVTC